MMLLLDTHVWVWSLGGDTRRIGARARRLLSKSASENVVFVSPATLFEVTALTTCGRLRLALPVEQWIREGLSAPGLRVAELSPSIAIDAGMIPRDALADPMDRLLVATARQIGATLLSADARMLDYAAATKSLRVQDASR